MARYHRGPRLTLPRALAVLGECTLLLYLVHGNHVALNLEAGHVLCANPEGPELWILRPFAAEGERRVKGGRRQLLRAADLHARFVQRPAEAYFNCEIPAIRKPQFCGELVMIDYLAEKELDVVASGETGEALYKHTFDGPDGRLAFPHLFRVSAGQFWVPRGPFQITGRGIHFLNQENLYGQIS